MYSCLQAIMKFIIMKIFITKILIKFIKISLLRRLLWREFSCWRCKVCNTYLSIQIFVRVNWFRCMWAHTCVISSLSRQRLLFFISAFFLCMWRTVFGIPNLFSAFVKDIFCYSKLFSAFLLLIPLTTALLAISKLSSSIFVLAPSLGLYMWGMFSLITTNLY